MPATCATAATPDRTAAPSPRRRWVTVFNRNRDDYQVPLALAEAGLLDCHVADFYAPDPAPRWLPRRLRRMRHPGLDRRQTRWSLASFLVQAAGIVLRLPMQRVFPLSDFLLGLTAARAARAGRANLLCYGSYVPPRALIPREARLVVFEFHPHPALTHALLEGDARRFPQVRQSFAGEERDLARTRVTGAWCKADRIICASDMTRRSLIHAGCDEGKIAVVPYGCPVPDHPPAERPGGRCKFLFVGQGIQRKGLHHLLLAWRGLAGTGAELTLVCYRIDPGIAEMAHQAGIRLLGHQSPEDLARLYAASDVFVMPSIVEGFGLVYLEALSAGCHVVGTLNTGLPDLPFDERAVSIVAAGDVEALAARLQQLAGMKQAGQLDPAAIAAQTGHWTWRHFRAGIAAEIAGLADAPSAPRREPAGAAA